MESQMRISEHVRATVTQDGAVLMNIKGGDMVTLNLTGSMIWQQLADGRSPEQIADTLSTQFGIPREQALSDVNEFLEQLEAQHLIESLESENRHPNVGPKPTGLFCDLFGRRNLRLPKSTAQSEANGGRSSHGMGKRIIQK